MLLQQNANVPVTFSVSWAIEMHHLHPGVFFFFFFSLFCFCSRVQITPLPPTVALTGQNNLFLCRKQTNNHDVILISIFCLQISNWQRQSSVSTVNRTVSTVNKTP